jgi:hypothetical protein
VTKKLEDLFNLEEKKKLQEKEEKINTAHSEVKSLDDSFQAVQEITRTLPQLTELDTLNDQELDELAKKSEDAFDELMDLGMNVEVRYSGRIFEVASSMMKNAIDAKNSKIDKKLKAIDLQLKKLKIDKDSRSDEDDMITGSAVVMDRNELMKKLTGKE